MKVFLLVSAALLAAATHAFADAGGYMDDGCNVTTGGFALIGLIVAFYVGVGFFAHRFGQRKPPSGRPPLTMFIPPAILLVASAVYADAGGGGGGGGAISYDELITFLIWAVVAIVGLVVCMVLLNFLWQGCVWFVGRLRRTYGNLIN